uniref:Uncharacterized protein n=1 Tax=Anopheles atroparvus TaxID=41427 RepID=A0A182IT53_ANOAO
MTATLALPPAILIGSVRGGTRNSGRSEPEFAVEEDDEEELACCIFGTGGFGRDTDTVLADLVRRLAIVQDAARLVDVERARSRPEVLPRVLRQPVSIDGPLVASSMRLASLMMVIFTDRRVTRAPSGPDVCLLAEMLDHLRDRVVMMMTVILALLALLALLAVVVVALFVVLL